MARQFFSGNTVEQALLAAAKHYGLEPEQIAYKQREKKHGFVNVRRRVVIEVDPSAPEQAEPAFAPVEVPEKSSEINTAVGEKESPPRFRAPMESWNGRDEFYDEDLSEEEALRGSAAEITGLLGFELTPSFEISDDGVEIDLEGEESGLLAAENGKALHAIEHLLPRMLRGFIGYGMPCRVDSGGFRSAREAELRELAEAAAAEVRQNAADQLLEPMNPAERRLVHMTLAEDSTVRTESEGDGFLKRVRILSVE